MSTQSTPPDLVAEYRRAELFAIWDPLRDRFDGQPERVINDWLRAPNLDPWLERRAIEHALPLLMVFHQYLGLCVLWDTLQRELGDSRLRSVVKKRVMKRTPSDAPEVVDDAVSETLVRLFVDPFKHLQRLAADRGAYEVVRGAADNVVRIESRRGKRFTTSSFTSDVVPEAPQPPPKDTKADKPVTVSGSAEGSPPLKKPLGLPSSHSVSFRRNLIADDSHIEIARTMEYLRTHLPREEWAVVELRQKGHEMTEIAKMLGCSRETAYRRSRAAEASLDELLDRVRQSD